MRADIDSFKKIKVPGFWGGAPTQSGKFCVDVFFFFFVVYGTFNGNSGLCLELIWNGKFMNLRRNIFWSHEPDQVD